jgi:hypothetical protein
MEGKCMKKIRTDKIFRKKLLFSNEKICHDEFACEPYSKYEFGYYFKVYKCWSLSGVSYSVEVPDMFTNDKNLYVAIDRAMRHMADDSPRYYRLKETLFKQDKWKSLE